jgi:hypothetical protein
MSRDTSNTNSSKGQLRTLISGVASFMNKSSKSVKDDKHKAVKKSKQLTVIKEEEEIVEAGSYMVDEISHEDFASYRNQRSLEEGDENAK